MSSKKAVLKQARATPQLLGPERWSVDCAAGLAFGIAHAFAHPDASLALCSALRTENRRPAWPGDEFCAVCRRLVKPDPRRQRLEDGYWATTHPDFRSMWEGVRHVLVDSAKGATLRALAELPLEVLEARVNPPAPVEPRRGASRSLPLVALRRFATDKGRNWKAALRWDWERGQEPALTTGERLPELYRLRNTHGPSWLAKFNLSRAEAEAGLSGHVPDPQT